MRNREVLEEELREINKTLEDHLMIREMDRAFGYIPPLTPDEQEYLFEICRRKHEIEELIKEAPADGRGTLCSKQEAK